MQRIIVMEKSHKTLCIGFLLITMETKTTEGRKLIDFALTEEKIIAHIIILLHILPYITIEII